MKPIPVKIEKLSPKRRAEIRRYFKRHPGVAALAAELRFARDEDTWVVGDSTGRRGFAKSPLDALRRFANANLPETL